jgi:hypothetical protein
MSLELKTYFVSTGQLDGPAKGVWRFKDLTIGL